MEEEAKIVGEKVGQEQIHGLLFSDKLSWQAIIYDLINSEQLNPWDIDICLLANKYLVKVRELEEANFFISSKVLLAASLLLRIKSEILLNHYLPSLDDILFGRKDERHYVQERIEFDEDVPGLIPRTPLPRVRKVTLQELIGALGRAIKTETRRIKRVIADKEREFETSIVMPKGGKDLKEQISILYGKLKDIFFNKDERVAFSDFCGNKTEDKISNFLPLLHLDYQHKVLAEQDNHFDEIWVWLKEVHERKHAAILEDLRKEAEEAMRLDIEREEREAVLEKEARKERKRKKGKRKKTDSVEKEENKEGITEEEFEEVEEVEQGEEMQEI